MSDDLVLYTNPMSRGRIARWMLEEVGAPYRTEILEYGGTMKGAEYLAINPMGKVPAIRHGDAVVTEGSAICAYLADAFPAAGLAPPPDSRLRAAYYRWMFYAAGPVEAAVTNKTLAVTVPPERTGMVGYGSFETVVDVLADLFAKGPWLLGDTFSALDVYLGSQLGWSVQFGTIETRPVFADYIDRYRARPAYQRARDMDEALTPAERRGMMK